MSTTAPSGRWPYRYSRLAIHRGAGRVASRPWMTRAAYSGQPSVSSTATVASWPAGGPVSGTVRSSGLSSLPSTWATSRPMPRMDRMSPRLGAVLTSRTLSRSSSASTTSTPTGVSGGRTRIPAWSSKTPSSRAEASMPSDQAPRTLRRPISIPPGSLAPGAAQGTTSPGAKLWAPQTTERSSPPASTRTRTSRSASGCGVTSRTRAVRMPARSSPTRWMVSISMPAKVSRSARVAAGTSTSTWSASHESGTRTVRSSQLVDRGATASLLEPPGPPLDAGQPADVVVGQGAQVGQAGAEHERPLDAGPGGEAGDLVGVVAAGPEHVGVDHAGAEQLDPALAAAGAAAGPGAAADEAGHVDLGPGLDEREVGGAQADLALLAEVGPGVGEQGALQVGHGQAAVDGQDLDLVEHRDMGRIRRVGPVAAPEVDRVHRRRPGLQGPDLHRRGVGAQHQLARPPVARLDVEGVLHGPGRVVGGDVEGLEVVPVGLDLGALDDPVAEADEDVDDLVGGPGHRVDGPAGRHPAGQGHVDPLGLEQGLVPLGLQLGPAGGQLGLEGGPGLVDAAAQVAAGLLVEVAEGALDLPEGRALGQVGLLGLAEGVQVGGGGDRLAPGGDEDVEVWGWHGRAPWGAHPGRLAVRSAVAPLGPGAG